MDNEKFRALVVELFEDSGVFGHYRRQHSAAVVEAFASQETAAIAHALVQHVGKKFEEHVASSKQNPASHHGSQSEAEGRGLPGQGLVESVVVAPAVSMASDVNQQLASVIIGSAEPTLSAIDPMTETKAVTPAVAPVGAHAAPPSPPTSGTSPQKQVPTSVGRGDTVPRKFSFRLRGGKLQAGVPYDGRIESADGAPGAVAHVINVQIPAGVGLLSDGGDPAHISGTPKTSGEVSIGLTYRVEAPGADDKALISSIPIFINHDPKSLWKDLPSDQSDPHWKPDVDTACQQAGVRKLIAASKRGRSHAHEGKFRDDDFRIVHSEESGWTVIAVADGAGSAGRSRRGSQIAVKRAVEVLLERLAGDDGMRLASSVESWHRGQASKETVISTGLYPVLGVAAFEACKAIEAEASAAGVAAKEYSTTLLVTAYKKSDAGHLFATYWVGDGGVGIYQKDGMPKLLGKVDSGEFAGQTRFLDSKVMTTEEIASRLNFALVDDFEALVAMTDGITDPWFMTDNNLESSEYWAKLWAEVEPSLEASEPDVALLAWLDFWSPGNHDDRTIAILW